VRLKGGKIDVKSVNAIRGGGRNTSWEGEEGAENPPWEGHVYKERGSLWFF